MFFVLLLISLMFPNFVLTMIPSLSSVLNFFLSRIRLQRRPYFKVILNMAYMNFLHNLFLHLLHSSLLAQSRYLSLHITWLKFGIPILVILLMLFWKEFLLLVVFLIHVITKMFVVLVNMQKVMDYLLFCLNLKSLTLLSWYIWIYGDLLLFYQ